MSDHNTGIILTPHHARWPEFAHGLTALRDERGGVCGGGFAFSSAVLATMEGVNVGATLARMAAVCECDCEVLPTPAGWLGELEDPDRARSDA